MVGPLIQLIALTTLQVYNTVMLIFPKPSIEAPGAQERYLKAECDFHRIGNIANTTSYRIAQTLTTSYVHAPLCPLPAELPFLVPKLTCECLAMVYRQVRMMEAERQIVEDLSQSDAANIGDMAPIYRELRQEAEVEADNDRRAEDEDNFNREHDNINELDNIMVHEVDNNMAGEADDNELPEQHVISPGS